MEQSKKLAESEAKLQKANDKIYSLTQQLQTLKGIFLPNQRYINPELQTLNLQIQNRVPPVPLPSPLEPRTKNLSPKSLPSSPRSNP